MDKTKKSQILKLSLIVALLIITPLVPTSLRPTYVYFVFNLVILALGAESGLLSFFSKTKEDKKPPASPPHLAAKPVVASESSPLKKAAPANAATGAIIAENYSENKPSKGVEKCSSDKIVGAAKVHKVKKCPSTPSLFFIGGGETEPEELIKDVEEEEEEEEEEADGLSGQELFTKAETFIGNFYKQLKMQREESWNRIHGFYQKAF